MKVALTSEKDWVLNTINDHCNDLIDSIDQQRKTTVTQTKTICDLKMAELEKHRQKLQMIYATFTRSVEFIGESADMAIATEFMFLKEGFHQRLNYLIDRYCNSHLLPFDINNKIYLRLNEGFDVNGAVGEVCGTPFVKAFTLENFPLNPCSQNSYLFQIQCRDICKTAVYGEHLPILQATISRDDEEEQSIECFVKPNKDNGIYTVYMFPIASGTYKICVFNRQIGPLGDLSVRGFPRKVDVY